MKTVVDGWPDTRKLWDRQVEAFKTRHRCVRFTLPGFDLRQPGRAYSLDEVVETLRRVVETVCPGERVTLLLHDWGCLFGYQFARRYPQLVARVIGVDIGDAGSRRHLRSLSLRAKAMIFGYQSWLALAWRIGGRLGDRMARTMARGLRCPVDPGTVGAQMGYPYYIQWTGAFGGYRQAKAFKPGCPMLYIYGQRKPFMFHSPHWVEELSSQSGNRALSMDTGHWVMVQRADEFNRAVLDWIAGDSAVR